MQILIDALKKELMNESVVTMEQFEEGCMRAIESSCTTLAASVAYTAGVSQSMKDGARMSAMMTLTKQLAARPELLLKNQKLETKQHNGVFATQCREDIYLLVVKQA